MSTRQIPLKAVAKVVNGFPFPSTGFDTSGHPLVRIRDIASTATETKFNGTWEPKAAINTGDVLVGMDGDFNLATWKGGPALLNQRVCCIRGKSDLWTRFLAYYLPSQLQAINDVTYATTVKHLASGDVERISVPALATHQLAPLVRHLDAKTAAIDALIAKKELLIEDMTRYREAVIADALRPTTASAPFKRIGTPILGKMLQPEKRRDTDVLVPYLKAKHVQWDGVVLDDELPLMWASPSEVAQLRVNAGDLLICEGGDVGRACTVTTALPENTIIQNSLHLVRPADGCFPGYLKYCMRHAHALGWLDVLVDRSTIAHLTGEKLKELAVPIAPVEKQREVALRLDEQTGYIWQLLAVARDSIRQLQGYRAAVISEAVTGKLRLPV